MSDESDIFGFNPERDAKIKIMQERLRISGMPVYNEYQLRHYAKNLLRKSIEELATMSGITITEVVMNRVGNPWPRRKKAKDL